MLFSCCNDPSQKAIFSDPVGDQYNSVIAKNSGQGPHTQFTSFFETELGFACWKVQEPAPDHENLMMKTELSRFTRLLNRPSQRRRSLIVSLQ